MRFTRCHGDGDGDPDDSLFDDAVLCRNQYCRHTSDGATLLWRIVLHYILLFRSVCHGASFIGRLECQRYHSSSHMGDVLYCRDGVLLILIVRYSIECCLSRLSFSGNVALPYL